MSGKLMLPCPHCDTGTVETVRWTWYLQGFLVFARYGSKPYIGCASCTRKKVLTNMMVTSVLGWWCFPWGLGVPLVLAQNALALAARPDETVLRGLLARQGIDVDDLILDEHGRPAGDTRLVRTVLAALHAMVWADGEADPAEIATGTEIATRMLDGIVTADEVEASLSGRDAPHPPDAGQISPDAQLLLMRAMCAVAAADGAVAHEEVEQLRAIGRDMGISDDLVERFVGELLATEPSHAADELRAIAAAVLGISTGASTVEVRAAYQRMAMDVAQEHDEGVREGRTEELRFAYETLLGSEAAA